jgi:hypothetical protein
VPERVVVDSVEELLAGATDREPLTSSDSKSGGHLERVVIDGERYIVKHIHVDDDWIMRATGDVRCRPLLVWTSGLLDRLPSSIDTAMVGVAVELGRHGWGGALLMHDRSEWLVPEGNDPVPIDQHLRFLDHMAEMHATFWGWEDDIGLTPYDNRWSFFCSHLPVIEAARGSTDAVPPISAQGWERFAERAGDVGPLVLSLLDDPSPLASRLERTPSTLIHGDFKFGNLGSSPEGRTLLIDWAVPGRAPCAAELGWYLSINAARLPQAKEDAIDAYAASLTGRGIDLRGWWDEQLALALLGALVQFGWEKALGGDDELEWWLDRARRARRLLDD